MKVLILLISLTPILSNTCQRSHKEFMGLRFSGGKSVSHAILVGGISRPLQAFTLCYWIRPTASKKENCVFSYANKQDSNGILTEYYQATHKVELYVKGPAAARVDIPPNLYDQWLHNCFTWSSIKDFFRIYINGQLVGNGTVKNNYEEILPGGTVILGQDQDFTGGGFSESDALVGDVAVVQLWDYELTQNQILEDLDCNESRGNVIDWYDSHWELKNVTVFFPQLPCRSTPL